uniref:Uncharacterized protein n=1 Tax=Cucumis sativus TaxID=3659 RepID=A0A0A0L7X0_CUCSA
MKAEIRFTITRRKHSYTNFTFPYSPMNFIKQFISRLHILVIQKRPQVHPNQPVIQQRRHCLLCVDPSMVYEHITRLQSHTLHLLLPQMS